jgi:hypothetical protein
MTRKQRAPRFGVFVEGAHYTSARGWDALVELWKTLAELHGVVRDRVDVHGFEKGQIELMHADPEFRFAGKLPLDAAIAMAHDAKPFDVLVVAFDALPENSKLRDETGCLPEMRWIFERFLARNVLPHEFINDSRDALNHYRVETGRAARQRDYYPRIDAIFMEPEFESLVICDEGLVRRAFEVGNNPRPWPKFRKQPPKHVLDAAIDKAGAGVRRRIRGDIKSNRHGWALEVVRRAAESPIFMSHGIMTRLQHLLSG